MSAIEFCERHNLTDMLKLLKLHSQDPPPLFDVYAFGVIELLVAGNAAQLEEARGLMKQIHPLEQAKALRETIEKQGKAIASVNKSIQSLEKKIEQMQTTLREVEKHVTEAEMEEGIHHTQDAQGWESDPSETQDAWGGDPPTHNFDIIVSESELSGPE
jgi:hypothetical protein